MQLRKYMIQETITPAYNEAFKKAINSFSKKKPITISENSRTVYNDKSNMLILKSLNMDLEIKYPTGEVGFKDTLQSPVLEWRLVALNYLGRGTGTELSNEPISLRQLEGGNLYYPTFLIRAIKPLISLFDHIKTSNLKKISKFYNATFSLKDSGDFEMNFSFFPMFPITIKYFKGDEEVPSNVSMHFDVVANQYLHTEDIAVVGELLTFFIIEESKD